MKSIYKSPEGKRRVWELYDRQMGRVTAGWKDLYVDTAFGKTHLIETGNPAGIPLLVFHGGNSTTAYTLLTSTFLFKDFHVYAVDTIGHPGKSDERCLSASNYEYGEWGRDVIRALGYEKMRCIGGSFGAGILAKTMCVAPELVERAVLFVPSGIKNAPAYKSVRMLLPMLAWSVTHKDGWLKKALLPMAVTMDNIDDDTFETAKASIENSKIKAGMPSDVDPARMALCHAKVFVLAAEKDCLFPAGKVLPQAKKMMKDCRTYLMKNRGHLSGFTDWEKGEIVRFLKKQ